MIAQFTRLAEESGFVSVGFSRPGRPLHMDYFLEWIASGKQGRMDWLARNIDIREDPRSLLPGCRTVISLARPYDAGKPATPDGYTASRYCLPEESDYHKSIKTRCRPLAAFIKKRFPESRSRICVDSAPILERSFAQAGGVGFVGKNTLLIVPGWGSYVFLAEILTTADLPIPRVEVLDNRCGDCTLCMEACPTGALEAPFVLNASRCLSYLTIEWKEAVDNETGRLMGDCFFGCDRCQEACPHNGANPPRRTVLPASRDFFSMEEETFVRTFGHTALRRAGLDKIRSNLEAMKQRAQ